MQPLTETEKQEKLPYPNWWPIVAGDAGSRLVVDPSVETLRPGRVDQYAGDVAAAGGAASIG